MAASSKRVAKKRYVDPTIPKLGRPTEYGGAELKWLERITEFALLGLTDEEIAGLLDVAMSTYSLWKVRHPAFSEALKAGRGDADRKVARALYTKALGYTRTIQKPMVVKEADGSTVVEVVDLEEHVPADTVAQIFWLKNRQRRLWRDRHDLEHTGVNGGPIQNSTQIQIGDLEPEQREQLRNILLGTKRPPVITDVEHEEVEDDGDS